MRLPIVAIFLLFSSSLHAQPVPATGKTDAKFVSFDQLMTSFLKKNEHVPGAGIAVARDGQIVYARGFGYSNKEKKEPVEPQALFRIASVSKPITGVAILHLVERGKLKLDDHVFDVLQLKAPAENFDQRWKKVTIWQLLHHTAGWDRNKKGGFDPMFRPIDIAKEVNATPPAGPGAIIQYMLHRPLDFDPGAKMAYSNFGYCILGRVIEKISRQSYEAYVRKEILAPLGITSMKIGRTLLEERAKGEVKYYDSGVGTAVLGPQLGKPIPQPYGAWYLEAMEAHGGWIASAEDLVRFAVAFDHPAKCKILKEKSIEEMFARPAGLAGHDADGKPLSSFYGCGWQVRPTAHGSMRNTWHNGSLPGTSTLLVRRDDGMTWAVLFNSRDGELKGKRQTQPAGEIDSLMHAAANEYLRNR